MKTFENMSRDEFYNELRTPPKLNANTYWAYLRTYNNLTHEGEWFIYQTTI